MSRRSRSSLLLHLRYTRSSPLVQPPSVAWEVVGLTGPLPNTRVLLVADDDSLLDNVVHQLRAVLRRKPSLPDIPAGTVLRVGDVTLDAERHEVVVRDEQVRLPLKQFQLLELLLENPGRVLPRTTILRRVWGSESAADSNTLEVQIKRLRENVEDDPS